MCNKDTEMMGKCLPRVKAESEARRSDLASRFGGTKKVVTLFPPGLEPGTLCV